MPTSDCFQTGTTDCRGSADERRSTSGRHGRQRRRAGGHRAQPTPRPDAAGIGGGGAGGERPAGIPRAQAASSSALPSCVVRPAQTQGPYFVDERLNRSDIRSDPASGKVEAGTPLTLALSGDTGRRSGGCKSLAGVQVDVWQANALGHYSDIGGEQTKGQRFLRGYQMTDAQGMATFQTVYPGWYNGRTVHIHFKLRRGNATFTSQLFFDEALTDRVYLSCALQHPPEPYHPQRAGQHLFQRRASADAERQAQRAGIRGGLRCGHESELAFSRCD